ncbi:MAG: dicarboxylate/amino acid:cation symporter [Marinilabiliales bacterium]|nr:MAG: dicarboxylate/amino acid:cation symporter [Marinilabiliales bacterium]
MLHLRLHWQILIALVLGILFGMFFKDHAGYVSWMGDVFLRALRMIIVPLVFSSIVTGIVNIGSGRSIGFLGIKAMAWYLSTSTLAILTGLFMVNLFRPGIGADLDLTQEPVLVVTEGTLGQVLMRIIPENVFLAFSDNSQMLSVIFFALLFGFFITRLEAGHREHLSGFFRAVFEVMMKITLFVIRFTPLGIFGLIASRIAAQDDLSSLVQSMGMYMFVVIAGILIHVFVTLPLIVKFIGKARPFRHFVAARIPLLTAFTTSSSNATLPLTMEAVKNNSGVSDKVGSFTLPLGATINMDGAALYECVAVIFIAQAYGIDLTIGQQVVVVLTSLLASVGSAGVPMAGLVMITIVLTAVGLPLEGVGLILAVDRIIDMFRTAANVWSDVCGAVVIARSEGEELKV